MKLTDIKVTNRRSENDFGCTELTAFCAITVTNTVSDELLEVVSSDYLVKQISQELLCTMHLEELDMFNKIYDVLMDLKASCKQTDKVLELEDLIRKLNVTLLGDN